MLSCSNGHMKLNFYAIAQLILALMVAYSFIGLSPFSVETLEIELSESDFSNGIRQIVFILAFSISAMCFYKLGGNISILMLPGFILLSIWCFVSIFWAAEPAISFRRVMLLILNAATLMMIVNVLTRDDIVKTLAILFSVLLLISLLAIPIIPGAVHVNSELFDSGLAGNWKGVFIHKNHAAPAVAFGVFLFIYQFLKDKNYFWLVMSMLGFIFIFFTQSKTTLALTIPSMLFGFVMVWIAKRPYLRNVVAVVMLALLMVLLLLMNVIIEAFIYLLDDPEALTGRATIWNLIYLALKDHFWLGLGYGSVWRVGDNMVIAEYAVGWVDWVFTLSHSHNGYLEAFISLGFIGFLIAIFVLIINPFCSVLFSNSEDEKFFFLFYSFFFFFMFHNFLETDLLNAADGRWLIFLVIYFMQCFKLKSNKSFNSKVI